MRVLSIIRSELAFLVAAATVAILYTVGASWLDDLSEPVKFAVLFVWIFGVVLWSVFAAVRHADGLAEALGEPYGTLILTISVICIEVAMISAVMFHGDANPELARDTMMAVMMIVLNFMVGVSLLIGGLRYREQTYNLRGTRAFLSVLITLSTVSLILPRFTISTPDPSLTNRQAVLFSLVTIALYGAFLAIQTIRHKGYFLDAPTAGVAEEMAQDAREHDPHGVGEHAHGGHGHGGHGHGAHEHEARSLLFHVVFLVLTLVPIVLLAKKLAILIDDGIATLHAPLALGGVLVAALVLAPEGLAAFHAASVNHLQRAMNICFGSALATISLTVPAVVAVSLLRDRHIILGLDPTEMVLLVLTLVLSLITFSGPRTNVLQGAVHFVVFVIYLILIFDP
jgi:Ca2+:H+ antiporter